MSDVWKDVETTEPVSKKAVLDDLSPYFEQAVPPPDAFTIKDVLREHPKLDADKARKVLDMLVDDGVVKRLGRFPGCGYHQFYQKVSDGTISGG